MSILSNLGARPITTSVPPATTQAGSAAAGAQATSASGKTAARLPVVESVATPDSVTISRQGLAARADQNGNRTLDVAQQFLSAVAQKLFGAAADGATVSYDTASLSTSEEAGASVSHSEDANGITDTAALGLSESAHFTGKGTITTADGHTVQFEIDVQYEADISASSSTHSEPAAATAGAATPSSAASTDTPAASGNQTALGAPDALALTGTQLPAIKFPGSLADLFDLLGRALQQPGPPNPSRADNGVDGNLTLRLQRLVNSAALLAPRAPSGTPARALQDSLAAAQGASPAAAAPSTTATAPADAAPSTSTSTSTSTAADTGAGTAAADAAPAATDRSKALANSYGTPPASSELASA